MNFNGRGIADIPVALLISKKNSLSETELSTFGCSALTNSVIDIIPPELGDKVQLTGGCQVVTDSKGAFSFYRLAGGEYFLVPYHDAALLKSGKLTISPSFRRVVMGHENIQLDAGFDVTGFRLYGGRVQLPSGAPVLNAVITLDGVPITKSNSKGAYEFEVSNPGDHTIDVSLRYCPLNFHCCFNASYSHFHALFPRFQVHAPKMKFSGVKVPLTFATERLPTISPSEIELCGHFILSSSLQPGVSLFLYPRFLVSQVHNYMLFAPFRPIFQPWRLIPVHLFLQPCP